jgi:hypothetical protein
MQDAHPDKPTLRPSFFERVFNASVIGLMILAVLVVLIPLLLNLLHAPESNSRAPERPPFEAHYADFAFHISDRPDLYQARKHDFGLVVRICHRSETDKAPAGCEVLTGPLVNQSGIWTYVTEPRSGKRFKLLKERPHGDALPGAVPMIFVPEAQIDKDIGGAGEAYELSRLARLLKQEQLATTELGWPIAACSTHPLGNRYCNIGFLIKGAFIEAHVFAEAGVTLNQAEVWAIASALDAKIRSLSIRTF